MKRTKMTAVVIFMLCSSLLLVSAGTVMAAEPGYDITEYWGPNAVTVDGKWTNADEWHDTTVQRISPNAVFEFKVSSNDDFTEIYMKYLIEFADRTNNAGDRWQICLGAPSTATAPSASDNKFEIEGHTTLKTYVGNGTGWTLTTNPTGVSWNSSLVASSPHDPAPHYVLEFTFNKMQYGWGAVQPPQGLRIAMYDASNPSQGWVAWPPEAISKDNPSRWGQIADYQQNAAPEGLTIGVMLLVSTVAVLSGSYYLRKRPKTTNLTPIKL